MVWPSGALIAGDHDLTTSGEFTTFTFSTVNDNKSERICFGLYPSGSISSMTEDNA